VKKTASSKRAKLPRSVAYTKTFQSSWDRYNKAGKRDMNAAREVMMILFLDNEIPPEYSDHELTGWYGDRELHIGGDFLLVYRVNESTNLLTFVNIGSHSELFG